MEHGSSTILQAVSLFDKQVDVIQERYGWSDKEVYKLSYNNFRRKLNVIKSVRANIVSAESKEKYRIGAYTSWVLMRKLGFCKSDFMEFIDEFGLLSAEEKEIISKQNEKSAVDNKKEAEKARKEADKILYLFKKSNKFKKVSPEEVG